MYIYIYHVRQNCLHNATRQMTVMVLYENRLTTYIYIQYTCKLHWNQNLRLNQNSRLLARRAENGLRARIAIQARICPCAAIGINLKSCQGCQGTRNFIDSMITNSGENTRETGENPRGTGENTRGAGLRC